VIAVLVFDAPVRRAQCDLATTWKLGPLSRSS
jgi:hypothetical protein